MTTSAANFKKNLLTEKETLEKELATVARRNPSNPADWEPAVKAPEDSPALRDDVAEKIESFEENVAIAEQLETRLAEVNDALERIENGGFGRCAACGKEIETERLLANAAAKTCKTHLR